MVDATNDDHSPAAVQDENVTDDSISSTLKLPPIVGRIERGEKTPICVIMVGMVRFSVWLSKLHLTCVWKPAVSYSYLFGFVPLGWKWQDHASDTTSKVSGKI